MTNAVYLRGGTVVFFFLFFFTHLTTFNPSPPFGALPAHLAVNGLLIQNESDLLVHILSVARSRTTWLQSQIAVTI